MMLGQVLKVDGPDGKGLILGEDRTRYTYSHVQVNGRQSLRPGQAVDFTPDGNEARDIYVLKNNAAGDADREAAVEAAKRAANATIVGAVKFVDQNTQKLLNKPPKLPAEGALLYFVRSMTLGYAQFEGRARRSEYLKFTLLSVVVGCLCLAADFIIYSTDKSNAEPAFGEYVAYGSYTGDFNIDIVTGYYLPLCSLVWVIISLIPTLAVMVRRYHDVGLSGWFVPLLLPFSFVIPVHPVILTLLDSQAKPNRFGDSPKYDHDAATPLAPIRDQRSVSWD